MTSDFNEVKAAVVRYLSSSAHKLRDQHSYARRIYVGIETNPFNENQRQTFRGLQIEFPVPTDNTFEMVPYAMTLLRAIWPPTPPANGRSCSNALPSRCRTLFLPKRFSSTCFTIGPTSGSCGICRPRWTRSTDR